MPISAIAPARAAHQPYPVTYQRELAPSWLHHAAVLGGTSPRQPRGPFRYLELGCGRGYSSLIHAASYPQGSFHAVDCDEAAMQGARQWARQLGVRNVRYHTAAFDDPSLRDLAPFDFIVLHGVYSWVDAATRATIRDLLRDRLTPGGLGYVSYNCLPGWAAEMPLRRLLSELGQTPNGASGIPLATDTVAKLRAAGLAYFTAHPAADRAVAGWGNQPVGYLAQEYLAEAWEPMWSVDVMAEMAAAGLAFAGSATLHDHHEEMLLAPAAARAIRALATPRLRTLALDFALNRTFRRDVFIAGDQGCGVADRGDLLIGCAGDPHSIPESIVAPRGRIGFRNEFIAALREMLAGGAMRLSHAAQALGGPHNGQEAERNLLWLVAAGALAPFVCEGDRLGGLERETAAGMLQLIADEAVPGWIAGPAIGGGCKVDAALAAQLLRTHGDITSAGSDVARARAWLSRLGVLPP